MKFSSKTVTRVRLQLWKDTAEELATLKDVARRRAVLQTIQSLDRQMVKMGPPSR